jgi:hypothetical protein
MNSDKEFLEWIYERMICVHGESDMYDYMINFKSIIDRQLDIKIYKETLERLVAENIAFEKKIKSLTKKIK